MPQAAEVQSQRILLPAARFRQQAQHTALLELQCCCDCRKPRQGRSAVAAALECAWDRRAIRQDEACCCAEWQLQQFHRCAWQLCTTAVCWHVPPETAIRHDLASDTAANHTQLVWQLPGRIMRQLACRAMLLLLLLLGRWQRCTCRAQRRQLRSTLLLLLALQLPQPL